MLLSQFKAGTYNSQYHYKSFYPSLVNKDWFLDDSNSIRLLSEANIKLGELNAFSQLVPSIDTFIKMHINKEALLSSRIEGTRTEIEETFQPIESIELERRDDWQEVQNYIQSINHALSMLNEVPISTRLMNSAHSILMQGVRGASKSPGEFRKSQNWIGGSTLKTAKYIPPTSNELPELMSDLEKFCNNSSINTPDLVKIAMIHYQFETIHPYLDGNGRVGRLLITLYLVERGLLEKPSLYLSDFFEKNRANYYYELSRVKETNNIISWINFFLIGVKETASNSIATFKEILSLKSKIENEFLPTVGKNQKLVARVIHHLYSHPVIDANTLANDMSISFATSSRLLDSLVKKEVLSELSNKKRYRKYSFDSYLDLFR
jgi:Fic family protein